MKQPKPYGVFEPLVFTLERHGHVKFGDRGSARFGYSVTPERWRALAVGTALFAAPLCMWVCGEALGAWSGIREANAADAADSQRAGELKSYFHAIRSAQDQLELGKQPDRELTSSLPAGVYLAVRAHSEAREMVAEYSTLTGAAVALQDAEKLTAFRTRFASLELDGVSDLIVQVDERLAQIQFANSLQANLNDILTALASREHGRAAESLASLEKLLADHPDLSDSVRHLVPELDTLDALREEAADLAALNEADTLSAEIETLRTGNDAQGVIAACAGFDNWALTLPAGQLQKIKATHDKVRDVGNAVVSREAAAMIGSVRDLFQGQRWDEVTSRCLTFEQWHDGLTDGQRQHIVSLHAQVQAYPDRCRLARAWPDLSRRIADARAGRLPSADLERDLEVLLADIADTQLPPLDRQQFDQLSDGLAWLKALRDFERLEQIEEISAWLAAAGEHMAGHAELGEELAGAARQRLLKLAPFNLPAVSTVWPQQVGHDAIGKRLPGKFVAVGSPASEGSPARYQYFDSPLAVRNNDYVTLTLPAAPVESEEITALHQVAESAAQVRGRLASRAAWDDLQQLLSDIARRPDERLQDGAVRASVSLAELQVGVVLEHFDVVEAALAKDADHSLAE